MRRAVFTSLCLLVLAGCGLVPETDDRHIVHSGEFAVIQHGTMTEIPIALSKSDAHALARALETGDTAGIQEMVANKKAAMIPAATRVRVVSESFNEREIQVVDGPEAGTSGWVPFEWLKFRRIG